MDDQTPQDLIQSSTSGDGGLDGKIDRDELGISQILIEAKRCAEDVVVGRPTVQSFVGALATRAATVGVLFTTNRHSAEATDASSAKNSFSTASQGLASPPPQSRFARTCRWINTSPDRHFPYRLQCQWPLIECVHAPPPPRHGRR
ncbi:restriction endonuclease [Frigoribacterium sp. CG_9.8]|uniref:restriction endonuclease n=1 Tax=Frigoribacterium sp. CG_9.8 TaxID=2787733 RepID=UPI0018C9B876